MRPQKSRELERRFWQQVPVSSSWGEAAEAVGVSGRVGRRWVAESGGVNPRLVEPNSSSVPVRRRLTFEDRCQIQAFRAAGCSIHAIAKELDRSPSVISREIARNRRRDGGRVYSAQNAQSKADRRARRPKESKLEQHPRLCTEVQDRLDQEHSPKQISNRLIKDFPHDEEMRVCAETIYREVYVQSRGNLRRDVHKRLRTGRAIRKPRRPNHGERRGRIGGMINISERPAEVADRAVPGHWEGDLIIGNTASNSAIGTLVERSTRFTLLLPLPNGHGADEVARAIIEQMSQLPDILRKTLTWDQGHELANHVEIAAAADLAVYFCDPHSPWQRGTNENTNGLLRQYFPKSTDLSVFPPDYLDHVAHKLNNRPRETLDWQTPAEAMDELLSSPPKPPRVA